MTRARTQPGFTLIELVVASGLSALVFAAAINLLASAFRDQAASGAQAALDEQGAMVMQAFSHATETAGAVLEPRPGQSLPYMVVWHNMDQTDWYTPLDPTQPVTWESFCIDGKGAMNLYRAPWPVHWIDRSTCGMPPSPPVQRAVLTGGAFGIVDSSTFTRTSSTEIRLQTHLTLPATPTRTPGDLYLDQTALIQGSFR